MTLTELVILTLAVSHVIEVWRHGEIAAERRAIVETGKYGRFLTAMLLCSFCLSPWMAWVMVIGCTIAAKVLLDSNNLLVQGMGQAWMLMIYGLAIARSANLLNDVTYRHCRTPGRD